jgi:hypothetical protein
MERRLTVVDNCTGNNTHSMACPMNAPTKVQIVTKQRKRRIKALQRVPHVTPHQHAGGSHSQDIRAIVVLSLVVFTSLESGDPASGSRDAESDFEKQSTVMPAEGLDTEYRSGRM